MKLYTKIVLLIIIIAISIGLFCSTMANRIMNDALHTEHIKKADILAQLIADNIISKVINNEVLIAQELLQKIISRNTKVDYAYVIGFDSELFTHTFSKGFPIDLADKVYDKYYYNRPHIAQYITSAGSVLDVAHPLIKGMDAHVHIGINESQSHKQLRTLQYRLLIITLTITLLGILIGVFLMRRITRPLKRLADSMRAFGKGKAEDEIVFSGGGQEVEALTLAFNSMISRRIESEEALRTSEEKYQDLYENAPDMYFSVNAKTAMIIECNQTIADSLGYTKEEIIGRSIFDKYTPESAKYAKEKIFPKFVKTGTIKGEELQAQRKNGSLIDVSLNVSAAYDDKGNILYSRSSWRDITEIKEAERKNIKLEAQLRQAQKMESIGTLAGGIAHDFNNILTPIIGYAELCLYEAEKGSSQRYNLSEILSAGDRAKDLVKQILTFSRHTKLEKKPVKISPILKEATKLLRATLPSTIDIQQHIDVEFDMVAADPTQVHQILMNLCTNASHAMQENGGVIEINLDEIEFDDSIKIKYPDMIPGKYLRLTVSDTGQGIPKEEIAQIFDPYFTTKEKGEGTGLGLALVHGIVKSHNGHIRVYSEQGKGTTFQVYLPLLKTTSKKEAVETFDDLPAGNEHILFVDDELQIVNVQKQILEKLGYKVTAITSSLEAIEIFQSDPDSFGVIITDMTMPHMTGDKLIQQIKKIRPNIPVVLCTGFSKKINEAKASDLDIDAFLMKPVDKAKLAETLRKVLDRE